MSSFILLYAVFPAPSNVPTVPASPFLPSLCRLSLHPVSFVSAPSGYNRQKGKDAHVRNLKAAQFRRARKCTHCILCVPHMRCCAQARAKCQDGRRGRLAARRAAWASLGAIGGSCTIRPKAALHARRCTSCVGAEAPGRAGCRILTSDGTAKPPPCTAETRLQCGMTGSRKPSLSWSISPQCRETVIPDLYISSSDCLHLRLRCAGRVTCPARAL